MFVEQNRVVILVSQVLAVLAVFLGILGKERNLRTLRPESDQTQVARPEDDFRYARLWEDPLARVRTRSADIHVFPDSNDELQKEFTNAVISQKQGEDSPLAIVVAVSARNLSETVETRLRARYALSASLAAAGYWSVSPKLYEFRIFPHHEDGEESARGPESPQNRESTPDATSRFPPAAKAVSETGSYDGVFESFVRLGHSESPRGMPRKVFVVWVAAEKLDPLNISRGDLIRALSLLNPDGQRTPYFRPTDFPRPKELRSLLEGLPDRPDDQAKWACVLKIASQKLKQTQTEKNGSLRGVSQNGDDIRVLIDHLNAALNQVAANPKSGVPTIDREFEIRESLNREGPRGEDGKALVGPVSPQKFESVHLFHLGSSDDLLAFAYDSRSLWDRNTEPTRFTTWFLRATIPGPVAEKFARQRFEKVNNDVAWVRRPLVTDEKIVQHLIRELDMRIPRIRPRPVRYSVNDLSDAVGLAKQLKDVESPVGKIISKVILDPKNRELVKNVVPGRVQKKIVVEVLNWLLDGETALSELAAANGVILRRETQLLHGRKNKNKNPARLNRMVLDQLLADYLVKPEGKDFEILILTESDTSYSRSMTNLLEVAAINHGFRARIRVVTYLRGLDGLQFKPAGSQGSQRSESEEDLLKTLMSRQSISEAPAGTSQFDYLQLRARRLRPSTLEEVGRHVAVGVLGSDPWDKMLVLQAAVPQLKGAVYFTSDLNSLYFQRDLQEFTRNLVVVSGANLVPETPENADWTWQLPPLRDAYQTVLAENTWRVLDPKIDPAEEKAIISIQKSRMAGAPSWVQWFNLNRSKQAVEVFEIGAGREIRMKSDAGFQLPAWLVKMTLGGGGMFVFCIFFAFGILAAIMVVGRDTEGPRPRCRRISDDLKRRFFGRRKGLVARIMPRRCRVWLINVFRGLGRFEKIITTVTGARSFQIGANGFLLVLMGLLTIAIIWLAPRFWIGDGQEWVEPVYWSLGISVWPTVLLRLTSILVGIWLLRTAAREFERQFNKTRRWLIDALPRESHNTSHELEIRLSQVVWRRLCRLVTMRERRPGKPVRAYTLDGLLAQLVSQKRRLIRIVLCSFVFYFSISQLYRVWPPFVPARGDTAFVLERIALAGGVALFIVHLFYCLDLHISSWLLLRGLNRIIRDYRSIRKADQAFKIPEPAIEERIKFGEEQLIFTISKFTASVGMTLLYPLTILIFLIVSRNRLFDDWYTHPSHMITYFVGAGFLFIAAVIVVFSARELKRSVLDSIREQKTDKKRKRKKSLELLESVKSIREGAFSTLFKQPVVVAIASLIAVLGSVAAAGPLLRLFIG